MFESFINAVVPYLIQNPKTSSRTIDSIGAGAFLDLLKPFGFPPNKSASTSSTTGSGQGISSTNTQSDGSSTGSKTFGGSSNSGSSGTGSSSSSSGSGNTGASNTGNTNNSGSGSGRFSVKSKPTLKRKKYLVL